MTLQIGQNIRRLRTEKGMTQEQLANRLNVSAAAISKWESGQSFPDIMLIMPLARLFGITTDELLDFDASLVETEINGLLEEHQRLASAGFCEEAHSLIAKARADHPADFRIMNRYLWDLVGGTADNDPSALLSHAQELTEICNCIEEGCRDPLLQHEALTMRAKLLHAFGETDQTIALLRQLPSIYQSAEQKTEQLFAKNTVEYRYWNHRNAYALAHGLVTKLIRSIWYSEDLDEQERIRRAEGIGDLFARTNASVSEPVFTVMEHMSFAMLVNLMIHACSPLPDIIRIAEKLLKACATLSDALQTIRRSAICWKKPSPPPIRLHGLSET